MQNSNLTKQQQIHLENLQIATTTQQLNTIQTICQNISDITGDYIPHDSYNQFNFIISHLAAIQSHVETINSNN